MKTDMDIRIDDAINEDEVIAIYKANKWSSANEPDLLISALTNSDTLVTAKLSGKLIGIGNAISDGFLVVYYPHMLVHTDYHGQDVGKAMMECLQRRYASFHQQILVADGNAIEFYRSLGFKRAGKTEPMWIHEGDDQ